MTPLRLGLVGCGGMARNHLRAIASLGDRVRLTAAVDVVPERAQRVIEASPGSRAASEIAPILGDVDALLVVLPHHLHYSAAMEGLRAGKHVLLEKPMANTEAECLELIGEVERSGLTLMIAYCMRYHPLVARLKELLDARAYGDCFQVSIWTEQLTRYPEGHWALDPVNLGGGQLFSHGCHYIDLLLWLLGEPIRGIHLGTKAGTPWMDREGTSNVAIEFEGGRLGYHFGTWGARGTRLRYSFHAHCTEGMLDLRFSEGELIAIVGGQEEVLLRAEPGKQMGNEIEHFIECVETGRPPLTNARDSLQGLRVIWRLYEAEERNQVADLRGLGLATQ